MKLNDATPRKARRSDLRGTKTTKQTPRATSRQIIECERVNIIPDPAYSQLNTEMSLVQLLLYWSQGCKQDKVIIDEMCDDIFELLLSKKYVRAGTSHLARALICCILDLNTDLIEQWVSEGCPRG